MQGQGQGYFEVYPESNCKCLDFYSEVGGWLSSKCLSLLVVGVGVSISIDIGQKLTCKLSVVPGYLGPYQREAN